MEGEPETLTIKQAAALLGVHPNTVRNRIKSGVYEAEKVITEHGETFMLSRSELEKQVPTNAVPSASQAPLSQPLPIVREVIAELTQSALEPFVRELGELNQELSRERLLREQAERRVEELERQLDSPRDEQNEGQETQGPGPEGSHTPEEAKPGEGNSGRPHRGLWRRIFGG